ncbi:hypothetical protein ACFLSY_02400 [Bacteroidota bacterium]
MDPNKLISYIQNPDLLDEKSIKELSGIVEDFPYFHTARLLLIKCLQKYNYSTFEEKLNLTSVHVPDRQILFNHLNQEKVVEFKSHDNFEIPDNSASENIQLSDKGKSIEDKQLLEFDYLASREESLAFDLKSDNENYKVEPDSRKDLIDWFIEKNPKISLLEQSKSSQKDISINSLLDNDDVITETLAEIYVTQGYYIKALNAYEKLRLKFPEKSTYFANLIKEVENMINNQ